MTVIEKNGKYAIAFRDNANKGYVEVSIDGEGKCVISSGRPLVQLNNNQLHKLFEWMGLRLDGVN